MASIDLMGAPVEVELLHDDLPIRQEQGVDIFLITAIRTRGVPSNDTPDTYALEMTNNSGIVYEQTIAPGADGTDTLAVLEQFDTYQLGSTLTRVEV